LFHYVKAVTFAAPVVGNSAYDKVFQVRKVCVCVFVNNSIGHNKHCQYLLKATFLHSLLVIL
jgi:hypothetical protein